MALDNAQRNETIQLSYYKPSAFGETPSGETVQQLRVKKEGLIPKIMTVDRRILGSREVQDIHLLGEEIEGSLSMDLAHSECEVFFESCLGSSFAIFTTTQTDISFAATDQSINSSADFGTIVAGQWIKVAGSALHNGFWFVATKSSSSKLILSKGFSSAGATLTVVDESAGASMTVTGKHLRPGTSLVPITLERTNADQSSVTYDVYNSFVVDQIAIDLKGDALIGLEISGIGKLSTLGGASSMAGSTTAQVSTAPFNATSNLIRIREGGSVLTDQIVSSQLTIKVNANLRKSLGNASPTGARQDGIEVSGQHEFYYLNETRRAIFKANTAGEIIYAMRDASGNVMILTIPQNHYKTLTNNAEDTAGDTLEKYSSMAKIDPTYLYSVAVDVL